MKKLIGLPMDAAGVLVYLLLMVLVGWAAGMLAWMVIS